LIWHDLQAPNDPELDVLAERYHLHPLHVEDCRHGGQRAKVEDGAGYIFVVLKPVHVTATGELEVTDLDLFLGSDYLITVQEGACAALRSHIDQLRGNQNHSSFFGMNQDDLPWIHSPHGTRMAIGLMVLATVGLLIILKKFDWL
jgi:Mg2+ and Co2+ transporter CorA